MWIPHCGADGSQTPRCQCPGLSRYRACDMFLSVTAEVILFFSFILLIQVLIETYICLSLILLQS
jgi:hypothetical protein